MKSNSRSLKIRRFARFGTESPRVPSSAMDLTAHIQRGTRSYDDVQYTSQVVKHHLHQKHLHQLSLIRFNTLQHPIYTSGGKQVSALSLSLSVEVAGRKRSEELLGSAMVRLESRLIGLDQEIHEWRMESGDKDEYMKKCHELEVENACLRSQNQMSGGVRQLERSYTVRLYHRSYS